MAAPQLDNWKAALAQELGMHLTPGLSQYFDLWSRAEGGGATNNPFNTTQPGFGATGSYNSVGVKNYGDPMQGIKATAATLKNGRYQNILDAMKSGDVHTMAQALYNSPWGTGGLVLKMLGGSVPPQAQPPSNTPLSAGAPPMTPGGGTQAPQVLMPTKLDALVNAAAPSAFGVSVLGRLGGLAGKIAQDEQVRIPFAPKLQPMPGFSPQPAQNQPSSLTGAPTGRIPDSVPVTGVAKTALTQVGIPYQWGGKAKLGSRTDCSGLLQASAAANGVNIGRTTYDQWKEGTPIPLNQLQAGDAVFFNMGQKGPEHVAIYIGNGRVVEDPHTGSVVEISKLAGRGAIGARRY